MRHDGRPYSLDLEDYRPLCIPCHRDYDPAGGRGRARAAMIAGPVLPGLESVPEVPPAAFRLPLVRWAEVAPAVPALTGGGLLDGWGQP